LRLRVFLGKSSLAPAIEPRVCQDVIFCECGLTLQEVCYGVMLNGPV
jgi:hypothetical protein